MVGALAPLGGARAQEDPFQRGLQAYADLDFDAAVRYLRDGLAAESADLLTPAERARFMTYLAAAEVFRGNRDLAVAVARRLMVRQPDYRPDELTFPPQVTEVFTAVRLEMDAVQDLASRGFRAFADLDFAAATQLLRTALASDSAGQFVGAERARVVAHIGAAEVYRGSGDSAVAALRQLAVLAPDYRFDALTFPPQVTELFAAVRRQTVAVDQMARRGVEAYGELDFEVATWLLRRALASGGAEQVGPQERARLLTYVAAAEFYRGRQDSALATLRRLTFLAPDYRIDELVFPPDVTALLATARRQADAAADLVRRGRVASGNRDYGNAVSLLRQALSPAVAEQLQPEQLAEALAYLGAAETLRGARNSGAAVFRALAIREPRYRVDDQAFPPQVTQVARSARTQVFAVRVALPRAAAFRLGQGELPVSLQASAPHEVTAEVLHRDGRPVRTLYVGMLADSLVLRWDGRDSSGFLVWDGRDPTGVVTAPTGYQVVVTSRSVAGQVVRRVHVPLELDAYPQDTLPHPATPHDSLYLPTRLERGPGLEALVTGVIGGAAIALLPSAMAQGSELSTARFAVGGAISVAGIVGLVARFPGRSLRGNIRSNEAIREEWRTRVAAIEQENATRASEPYVMIHAGEPVVREVGR